MIDDALSHEPEEKPKERQPIMRSEENQASMNKELANCYKRIKMYEYEISKIEEAQASMNLIQKYQLLTQSQADREYHQGEKENGRKAQGQAPLRSEDRH